MGATYKEIIDAIQRVEAGESKAAVVRSSLPAMLKRFALQVNNCVEGEIGAAAWIKTQEVARAVVLTVPARSASKSRKRVVTQMDWFSKEGLHISASQPRKRIKTN